MLKFKQTMHMVQKGQVSAKLLIICVLILTTICAAFLLLKQPNTHQDEHHHDNEHEHEAVSSKEHADEHSAENEHQDEHSEEGLEALTLTTQQMVEQGLQVSQVEVGEVTNWSEYPARLIANTDQQAHVSSSFSGYVEDVKVSLGQSVHKGQILATLLVPDLVDQQANLQLQKSNLELAKQEYQRERDLWTQGISAKQDYQRAENNYRQAQIQVQAVQSRLKAFDAVASSHGRYQIKAPISGVISQKDIVIGENIQLSNQLFVIDQLDQLWLEFIVPYAALSNIAPQQKIQFKSLASNQNYEAQIQNLNSVADESTGRLKVVAKVLRPTQELRPNLMVNVLLGQSNAATGLKILKSAVQTVEGKPVVFLVNEQEGKVKFIVQNIMLAPTSTDQTWVQVSSGLTEGQRYVSEGSFLLKSELEKGEATHAH